MYSLYEKEAEGSSYRYRYKRQISLFGCNSGYIPWLLAKQLELIPTDRKGPPLKWRLNVASELERVDQSGDCLIINLKPNSKKPNLSFYEVVDVWGYSYRWWTPIMMHLHGLFIDENPMSFNDNFSDKNFLREEKDIEKPIFSMLYLDGSIENGKIIGKWTAPRPSATNSVLLWPETLEYFYEQSKLVREGDA